MNVLGKSSNAHVGHLTANQVEGDYHFHGVQVRAEDRSVYELLEPVEDASHTRDRKRSPPDSACARGTRVKVVKKYTTWTADNVSSADEPHVLWVHGYAGSGKSAISQEVCDTSKRQRRPVVSFFFFRNAGERSRTRRLATTLASQMAAVIPETEPFIRVAVKANPALLRPDDAAVCLQSRMEQLVYEPFKAAVEQSKSVEMAANGSVEALPQGVVHRLVTAALADACQYLHLLDTKYPRVMLEDPERVKPYIRRYGNAIEMAEGANIVSLLLTSINTITDDCALEGALNVLLGDGEGAGAETEGGHENTEEWTATIENEAGEVAGDLPKVTMAGKKKAKAKKGRGGRTQGGGRLKACTVQGRCKLSNKGMQNEGIGVKGKEKAGGEILQREWKGGYEFRSMESLKHTKYLSWAI